MSADERRSRMFRPAPAGAVLDGLTRRLGVREQLEQYRIWAIWESVVGPQTAAHAQPFRLRDGELEVRVDHPVWMQQLQLLKPRILQRINAALAPIAIRDIHWRQGQPREERFTRPEPPLPPPLPLTPEQQAYVDLLLPDDGDDLHAAWRKLLARHVSVSVSAKGKEEKN